MAQYYYLAMALPSFRLGQKLPFLFSELMDLFALHLSAEDLKAVKVIMQLPKTEEAFEETIASSKGFIRDYFSFELACKKTWVDVRSFQPVKDFPELGKIYTEFKNEPLLLCRRFLDFKLQKIEELIGLDQFSQGKIFGYAAQFMIAKEWLEIEQAKNNHVDELEKELQ